MDMRSNNMCSMDPILNNVIEIMSFFRTYNTKPEINIRIHAHHTEHSTAEVEDEDGNTTTIDTSYEKTDFAYTRSFDAFILPYGFIQVEDKVTSSLNPDPPARV